MAAGQGEQGESSVEEEEEEQNPHRREMAILPALGGNSDIGFVFGAFLSTAKFHPDFYPYRWQGTFIAITGVKDGPDGVEFPTYAFITSLDFPGLADGRLRLKPFLQFSGVINAGYFGLGNASEPDLDEEMRVESGGTDRPYSYKLHMIAAVLVGEVELHNHFKMQLGLNFSHYRPHAYEHSALFRDITTEKDLIHGTTNHASLQVGAGISYDTRDHEVVPNRGMYHQLALRFAPGPMAGTDHTFGGATLDFRFFLPFVNDYLVAGFRLLGDVMFGTMPFYELSRIGFFKPFVFGGSSGIRGIPEGRYHGQAKVIGNFELRTFPIKFMVKDTRFRIGAAGFVDTGRVWATLKKREDLDGTGINLKFGVGGGPRFQWGEALCIRFDVAYSPQATDVPGGPPVGMYMEMENAF